MQSFERTLKNAGRFGLFQKRFLMVYYISCLFCAFPIFCGVFVVYTPPHRCFIPEIDVENSSYLQNKYLLPPLNPSNQSSILSRFIPIEYKEDGKPQWSQCYRYMDVESSDYFNSSRQKQISCDKGWKYFVEPGVVSATMEFNLVCNNSWLGPLVIFTHMLGFMCGSIVGGIVSDRLGRCFTVLFSSIVMSCSLLAVAFLPIWNLSYISWFLLGFSLITKGTSGIILIYEQIPSKYRHKAGFLNMLTISFSNTMLVSLCYLLTNWRHLVLVYAIVNFLVTIPLYLFTHESYTWLLANKKYKRMTNLIKKIASVNKRTLDNNEMQVFEAAENERLNLPESSEENKNNVESPGRFSYLDMFKISFLRRRLLIFCAIWFSTVMCYYGLSINTNNIGGNRYVAAFVMAAIEIPAYLFMFFVISKFGGRKSFILSSSVCGVTFLVTAIMLNVAGIAVIFCNLVGKFFVSGSFAILYLFTGDLFPTLLRNQAYGASSFVSRFAGILIPYILYLGTNFRKEIPYLIMGSIAVTAAIVTWFLPETKTCSMPGTMEEAKEQEKFRSRCLCCQSKKHLQSTEVAA